MFSIKILDVSIKIKLKLPIKLKQYCISPSLNIYAFCNNLGHTNKIMFISLVPYTKFDDKNWIYCGIYYYYGIIFIVIIIVWYTGFVLSHGLLYTSLSWERAFMEKPMGWRWIEKDVSVFLCKSKLMNGFDNLCSFFNGLKSQILLS